MSHSIRGRKRVIGSYATLGAFRPLPNNVMNGHKAPPELLVSSPDEGYIAAPNHSYVAAVDQGSFIETHPELASIDCILYQFTVCLRWKIGGGID